MKKRHFIVLGSTCAAAICIWLLIAYVTATPDGSPAFGTTSAPVEKPEAGTGTPEQRTVPAGFGEYRSTLYHFSLLYPHSLSPEQFKEPGTAMTVVFEDPFSDRGFQVFVVPYGEKKITEERFKADVPSGVMTDPKDVKLDGVAATTFYSRNQTMGDTYEIWLIYHGFLYEVTTYKELDTQLNEIMKTWKFL